MRHTVQPLRHRRGKPRTLSEPRHVRASTPEFDIGRSLAQQRRQRHAPANDQPYNSRGNRTTGAASPIPEAIGPEATQHGLSVCAMDHPDWQPNTPMILPPPRDHCACGLMGADSERGGPAGHALPRAETRDHRGRKALAPARLRACTAWSGIEAREAHGDRQDPGAAAASPDSRMTGEERGAPQPRCPKHVARFNGESRMASAPGQHDWEPAPGFGASGTHGRT